MSVVTLSYNPNDFFYATSYNTPSVDTCTQWITNDTDFSNCETQSWVDASVNCFKYKLCKEKNDLRWACLSLRWCKRKQGLEIRPY